MLLAIDCAFECCSACLFDRDEDRVVARRDSPMARGHAEHLIGVIESVLSKGERSYGDLTAIAATAGPGSFTGVRVALATARGLALALGLKACGISTLQAMAFEVAQKRLASGQQSLPIAIAFDGRRGELYWQIFHGDGRAVSAPAMLSPAEALETLPHGEHVLAGSGAGLVQALSTRQDLAAWPDHHVPDIAAIARLAATKEAAVMPASPIYLRPPDAQPHRSPIQVAFDNRP